MMDINEHYIISKSHSTATLEGRLKFVAVIRKY